MIDIFMKIKKNNNFSQNEETIAQYILQHPDHVLNMNVKQFANACYVSQASIYRFCEKLELSGYSELKVKISSSIDNYMKSEKFDFDFPVKKYQTHYEIAGKIKEDYEKTVASSFNLLSLDQLKKATHAMKKAKYIDVYATAGNVYFAENFKFQMKEIGIEISVPIDEYQQRLSAASSDKTHLAIVISFGGRGINVQSIMGMLKDNGVPILLISSYDYVPEVEVQYQLYISPYENHYNKISSFSTRLSILYVLDVLYTCYFELDYEKNIEKKLEYYETLRRFKKK